MKKCERTRYRYILFKIVQIGKNKEKINSVENWIYKEVLKFFGEYGFSQLDFKFIEYKPNINLGIVRCNRDRINNLNGFLAMLNNPRTVSLKTSGTIKSLREISKNIHKI